MKTLTLLPLALAALACSADRAPVTTTPTDASAPATASAAPPKEPLPAPVEAGTSPADAGEVWGGLGLSGVGESGGMPREIGLGSIGAPSPSGSAETPAKRVHLGTPSVSGRLPPEVISRIVNQGLSSYRACYDDGLRRSAALRGQLRIRFVIGKDGTVNTAAADGSASDLPDAAVIACLVKTVRTLRFPPPEGGTVLVGYPFVFTPPDAAAPAAKP